MRVRPLQVVLYPRATDVLQRSDVIYVQRTAHVSGACKLDPNPSVSATLDSVERTVTLVSQGHC